MSEITFTQFLRPHGTRVPAIIARPDEISTKAKSLQEKGCRLETEVLMTGEVSFTVERDVDGEVDTMAWEICSNGPPVLVAVDKLITEAFDKL